MSNKPKMPEDKPKIRFEIEAELLHDYDRFSDGGVMFRLANAEVSITAGDESSAP